MTKYQRIIVACALELVFLIALLVMTIAGQFVKVGKLAAFIALLSMFLSLAIFVISIIVIATKESSDRLWKEQQEQESEAEE